MTAAPPYPVTIARNLVYVERASGPLAGDLYRPEGCIAAPALIAVHGGGWQVGSPAMYQHWAAHLAAHGYAVFAPAYRLSQPGRKSYPEAARDVKAAVQFVRAKAATFGIDRERLALMGDSAGAHLAALVALAHDAVDLADAETAHAGESAAVKALVGFYGVYDLLAQWQHDQRARPFDQIVEKFLGAAPMADRRLYFEASPISHATVARNGLRVLLIAGTEDEVVDPATQSQAFLAALKQAGFFVRSLTVPAAGHFWVAAPIEPGSAGALVAPKVLRFLADSV